MHGYEHIKRIMPEKQGYHVGLGLHNTKMSYAWLRHMSTKYSQMIHIPQARQNILPGPLVGGVDARARGAGGGRQPPPVRGMGVAGSLLLGSGTPLGQVRGPNGTSAGSRAGEFRAARKESRGAGDCPGGGQRPRPTYVHLSTRTQPCWKGNVSFQVVQGYQCLNCHRKKDIIYLKVEDLFTFYIFTISSKSWEKKLGKAPIQILTWQYASECTN